MIKFGHNLRDLQFDPFVPLIHFFIRPFLYVFRCRIFIPNVINFSSALIMEVGDSSHKSTTSYQTTYDVTRALFLIGPVVKTKRPVLVSCFILAGRGSAVVKVLCYKSEGRWFDPSWCQCIFHPIALWTWGRLSL